MPAVSPARLKREVADLIETVTDPEGFEKGLDDLLDRYADRTYRPAKAGLPASLLQAYHAPRPVLRAVEVALAGHAADSPEAALDLADQLWSKSSFEPKYLAVRILKSLPWGRADAVMLRLAGWLGETVDETLQTELVRVGVSVDEPSLTAIVAALLDEGGTRYRSGLSALGAIARNASPEALPAVFRLFGKALENPDADRTARLLNLGRDLAERSPVETAYFLRQQYLISMRPEIGRILRQVMPLFPDQLKKDLRRMMRENQS